MFTPRQLLIGEFKIFIRDFTSKWCLDVENSSEKVHEEILLRMHYVQWEKISSKTPFPEIFNKRYLNSSRTEPWLDQGDIDNVTIESDYACVLVQVFTCSLSPFGKGIMCINSIKLDPTK